jgi:hypothetical protein
MDDPPPPYPGNRTHAKIMKRDRPYDKVKLRLQDYLDQNVWITTSGNYSTVALQCAMETMGSALRAGRHAARRGTRLRACRCPGRAGLATTSARRADPAQGG